MSCQFVIRSIVGVLFVFVALSFLSACSTGKTDYLEAKTIPAIELPEGADDDRVGELYRVPESKSDKKLTEFEVPLPPVVAVREDDNIASRQTMGDRIWVLNGQSPANTWSQLLSFWQTRGVALTKRDLSTATIETDWFSEAVQPGFAVRYQLRLERGLQENSTEIYLSNDKIRVAELQKSESQASESQQSDLQRPPISAENWTDAVQDRAHANWLAEQLLILMNNPNTVFGDSYLATTIELPPKLGLSQLNSEPVLISTEERSRLEQALNRGLETAGLLIYDQDVQQGVFHFDEYDERKPRLLGLIPEKGRESKKSRYTLNDILAHLLPYDDENAVFSSNLLSDKELSNVPGYLLALKEHQGQTLIFVRDGYGKPLAFGRARELLDTIRLRLI